MDSYGPICFSDTLGFNDANDILPMAGVSRALTESPWNGALTLPPAPQVHVGPRGAVMTRTLWQPGRQLKIGFQGGSSWQKDQVKKYAPQWTEYANIKFTFVDSGEVDILIAFLPDFTAWSKMGTVSSSFSLKNQTSMVLGQVQKSKSEDEISHVILHEFGHALGMIHEHQTPYANISWNKTRVYKDLGGPPNYWNKAAVDEWVFNLYTLEEIQLTAFDPDSIMLYYCPDEWTTDGKGTSFNANLSALDIEYIRFCYPADTYDAGEFNTTEIRPEDKPQLVNDKFKYYYRKYDSVPQLPVGITSLDISQAANIRITAGTSEATTENFKASLQSWGDTILYSASMTYLEKSSDFDYIQTGVYNTKETRHWNKQQMNHSKRINFATPVSATDIDKKGFTIHADSWADSILYSAGVTWLAYPADQPGVTSGRFDTQDVRPDHNPQAENSGIKDFSVEFSKTPKVMMALDSLDYDHSRNLRVRLSTSSVNSTGMTWHLESWWDSIMYSSGASFFAWT